MRPVFLALLILTCCLSVLHTPTTGEPQSSGNTTIRSGGPDADVPRGRSFGGPSLYDNQFGNVGYDGFGGAGHKGVAVGQALVGGIRPTVDAGLHPVGSLGGGLHPGGPLHSAGGLHPGGGLGGGLHPGLSGGLPGVGGGFGGLSQGAFSFTFEQYIQHQVSFSYVHGFTAQHYPWIGFSRQVVNQNALFYPEYGLFQARTPGIYFFTFGAVSDDRFPFRIALTRGFPRGIPIVHAYGDDRGYHATSQSSIAYLDRGEFCYLSLNQGRIYESSSPERHYTSFTGTLLSPDWRQLQLTGRSGAMGRSGGGDDLPKLPPKIAGAVPASEGFDIRSV